MRFATAKRGLGFIALLLLASRAVALEVTVVRNFSDANCTSGYLIANGKVIAYALERPWQGNAPFMSSIVPGTYSAFLRYKPNGNWRIQLNDVPGRGAVQIHMGKTPEDTAGCILVGARLGPDLCSLIDTPGGYQALRTAFYGKPNPVDTPNQQITVKVVDDVVSYDGRWLGDCSAPDGKLGADLEFKRTGASYNGTFRATLGGETDTLSINGFRVTDPATKRGRGQAQTGEELLDIDCRIDNQTMTCTMRNQRGVSLECRLQRLK